MAYRHLCLNVYHKLKIFQTKHNYMPLFSKVPTTSIPPSNNPILLPAFHGPGMVPPLSKSKAAPWESCLNPSSRHFPMLNPLPNLAHLAHKSLPNCSPFSIPNTTFPGSVSHVFLLSLLQVSMSHTFL